MAFSEFVYLIYVAISSTPTSIKQTQSFVAFDFTRAGLLGTVQRLLNHNTD